jgi:hypothetical protein
LLPALFAVSVLEDEKVLATIADKGVKKRDPCK